MLVDQSGMEPLRQKECGKHEKRNDNEPLRLCQPCGRQFFLCELCRSAKNISAPLNVCIKCAPAMKTVSNVLQKKDTAITDYHKKLIQLEAEIRGIDGLKRKMDALGRLNEDTNNKLHATEDELENYKKDLEQAKAEIDRQNEELKRKRELSKNLGGLQKTLDYSDVLLVCGNLKYQAHKCILASRSEYLRDLLCKPPEKHIHTLQCKNHNEMKNKNKEDTDLSTQTATTSPIKVANGKAKAPSGGSGPTAAGDKPPANKPAEKKQTASPSTIEICDSHTESMPFLMNYIYTSDVEKINEKSVLYLIRTAEKLTFPDLRAACLTYMYRHITKATAVPFLIKAYEYNDKWLKNLCSKFIFEENVELSKHPDYISFKKEDPKLALELYEGHIKEIDEINANFKTNESSNDSENSITTTITTKLNLSLNNKSSNPSTKSSNDSRNGISNGSGNSNGSYLNTARSYNSTTLPMIRQSVNAKIN